MNMWLVLKELDILLTLVFCLWRVWICSTLRRSHLSAAAITCKLVLNYSVIVYYITSG